VGKTTAMLALAKQLTDSGKYTAVMLSVEVGAPFSQDIAGAEKAILAAWRRAISIRLPQELQPPAWPSLESGQRIGDALSLWAQASPRPLVLFVNPSCRRRFVAQFFNKFCRYVRHLLSVPN
jgi:hypothetical protein